MLTSGLGFLSHGTQDLYPTYLQENKRFTKFDATVATIIGSCGAIAYVSFSVLFLRLGQVYRLSDPM
jgi:hypothetical protein